MEKILKHCEYGLLGEHLSHSFSPQIHEKLGRYEYELVELPPRQAREFLIRHEFSAYNVTIPYKKLAFECCDELSPEAKETGSVNTVVVKNGRMKGYNTDIYGFTYMIEKLGVSVKDKKCIVLGNGGASATVQYVLQKLGAGSLDVFSRSGELTYERISEFYDAEIIVNATPVGMYPNCGESVIQLESFKNCKAVLDLIYNPSKTKLLLDAEDLDIPCINGLTMLVAQAKKAYEHFFDTDMPDTESDRIVNEIESQTKNICLVGMPGCGKSTVGAFLSAILERKLVDSDILIKERTGSSPAEIIEKQGEAEFRKIESLVLADITKQSGLIIATGGGCVTIPENIALLRQNSTVVFIERELSALATNDRPLSKSGTLQALYEKRLPLYESVCDFRVKNEDAKECAAEIAKKVQIGRKEA